MKKYNGYDELSDRKRMQHWAASKKFHDDNDKRIAELEKGGYGYPSGKEAKKSPNFTMTKKNVTGKLKIDESQLRKMVSKIIKESLEELGGEDDFQPNGYKGMNNYGGNEIQVNRNGDSARIRFQDGEVTDWLEIEFDEEGVAYVTTPHGEQEKLSDYMRY